MSPVENWPLVATYHPAYIPHGSRLAAKFVEFQKKSGRGFRDAIAFDQIYVG